jgi:hypothetical protein
MRHKADKKENNYNHPEKTRSRKLIYFEACSQHMKNDFKVFETSWRRLLRERRKEEKTSFGERFLDLNVDFIVVLSAMAPGQNVSNLIMTVTNREKVIGAWGT